MKFKNENPLKKANAVLLLRFISWKAKSWGSNLNGQPFSDSLLFTGRKRVVCVSVEFDEQIFPQVWNFQKISSTVENTIIISVLKFMKW